MRIGWLKFIDNRMYFDKKDSMDQLTVTSCNTEFRNNKRYMTTLHSPAEPISPGGLPSVKDTISLVSGRTPKSHATVKSVALKSRVSSHPFSTYHAANPNPQRNEKGRNLPILSYDQHKKNLAKLGTYVGVMTNPEMGRFGKKVIYPLTNYIKDPEKAEQRVLGKEYHELI